MAVFTGALWPGDRLGPEDVMYKCPFCNQAGYDEIYLFYTCPRLVTNRRPMVVKTQHLVDIARRDNYNPPATTLEAYSLTQTPPQQWTHSGVHVAWGQVQTLATGQGT
eukprot:6258704-Karenia_brevis.AAC.1